MDIRLPPSSVAPVGIPLKIGAHPAGGNLESDVEERHRLTPRSFWDVSELQMAACSSPSQPSRFMMQDPVFVPLAHEKAGQVNGCDLDFSMLLPSWLQMDLDAGESEDDIEQALTPARDADIGQTAMPSYGSQLHAASACKPCLFTSMRSGCYNGIRCRFCHFPHKTKRPRPCKSKRARCKKLVEALDVISHTNPDQGVQVAQWLAEKSPYIEAILQGRRKEMQRTAIGYGSGEGKEEHRPGAQVLSQDSFNVFEQSFFAPDSSIGDPFSDDLSRLTYTIDMRGRKLQPYDGLDSSYSL